MLCPNIRLKRLRSFHDGLENKRVLVLGYSYKPNVGDSRETPVKFLIEELRDKGAEILVHDPLVEPRDSKLGYVGRWEIEM